MLKIMKKTLKIYFENRTNSAFSNHFSINDRLSSMIESQRT